MQRCHGPLPERSTGDHTVAGERIALQDASGTFYLLTEHLGSVVAVLDGSGAVVAVQRDRPFGPPRLSTSGSPTDRGFTGQRELAQAGFADFNARWFDTSLGGFASPDSLIPDPFSPQSLNRYGYVLNNPLRYTDPTGHRACDDFDAGGRCVTAPPAVVTVGTTTTRYTSSTAGRTITVTAPQPPPPVDYSRSESLSQTEQRRNEPASQDQVTTLLDTRLTEYYDPWNTPGRSPTRAPCSTGLTRSRLERTSTMGSP